jgi:hypothetical protein
MVNGQRPWIEVNPKTEYVVDETFYLRWLPTGATKLLLRIARE